MSRLALGYLIKETGNRSRMLIDYGNSATLTEPFMNYNWLMYMLKTKDVELTNFSIDGGTLKAKPTISPDTMKKLQNGLLKHRLVGDKVEYTDESGKLVCRIGRISGKFKIPDECIEMYMVSAGPGIGTTVVCGKELRGLTANVGSVLYAEDCKADIEFNSKLRFIGSQGLRWVANKELEIPESVIYIGDKFGYGSCIENLILTGNIEFSKSAFTGFSKLKKLTIKDGYPKLPDSDAEGYMYWALPNLREIQVYEDAGAKLKYEVHAFCGLVNKYSGNKPHTCRVVEA